MLATADELGVWLGEPIAVEDVPRAEFLLGLLSGAVVELVGGTAAAAWDETTAPSGVRTAVLQIAARIVDNPSMLQSESFGFYGYSTNQVGAMFTAAERRGILESARTDGGGASGATSMSLWPTDAR